MRDDGRYDDTPRDDDQRGGRFRAEYEALVPRLMGYILTATGERETALDLLQETMIRFWRSPFYSSEQHHSAEDSRRYAFRIAANLLKDHRRSRARYAEIIARFEEEHRARRSPEVDPDLPIDLQRGLQRLKPRERELLWLAHGLNYTHTEIADLLGYRPLSVRVLLSRARNRLRHVMVGLDGATPSDHPPPPSDPLLPAD